MLGNCLLALFGRRDDDETEQDAIAGAVVLAELLHRMAATGKTGRKR